MKIGIGFIFLIYSFSALSQVRNADFVTDFEDIFGLKVTDIKQDRTGFLWIGTSDGLYRYDGYDFKLFEPQEKTLGSSIINTIFIDSKGGMWVGTRGGLLFYDDHEGQLVNFTHDPNNVKTIGNDIINSIVEDHNNNIWIAFSKGGLDLFETKEKMFYHFKQTDNTGLLSDDISDLHIDKTNHLWVSTWDFGVNRMDLNSFYREKDVTSVRFRSYPQVQYFGKERVINFLYEDSSSGKLYVGTNGYGLFEYRSLTDDFIPLKEDLFEITLYNATPFANNKILLATSHGVRLFNLKNQSIEQCPPPLDQITGEIVKVVFVDKKKTIWVGTENGLMRRAEKKITHHRLDPTKNAAPINNITAICEQGNYLWMAAWGGGLHLKDQLTGNIIRVNQGNDLLTTVWDFKLMNDNNTLLIASHKGVVKLDVRRIKLQPTFPEVVMRRGGPFTTISKNRKGPTWIGTWEGSLYTIDLNGSAIKKFEDFSTKGDFLQTVLVDSKNQLWFGTRWSGLVRLSNHDGKIKSQPYSQRFAAPYRISNDCVLALHEDKFGRIWVGTDGGGISIVDPTADSVMWILKGDQNLPSNTVKAFIEDQEGKLWVSFKAGLSRYEPANGFTNYTVEDGLESFNFNINAATRSDSMLYFGSQNGYYSFRPADVKIAETDPTVVITGLEINNKSFFPGQTLEFGTVEKTPISELKDLTLSYKASTITFEFSTLNFINPNKEIYAYKMEGISEDWTYTNASNRKVNFSNLAPGDYAFRVKAVRHNAKLEDKDSTIQIHIIPPFWQTLWFKIGSGLSLIGLLYLAHLVRLERLNRQKLKFEKLADDRIKEIETKNIEIQHQTAKLHEADKSKLEFFTNLSHEFRTPLMLIIGPLTALVEKNRFHDDGEKLTMIQRNAQRLLRLMDQIMDVTKIDSGNLKVELEEGNIVNFIKDIASSFQYLADTKKIQYESLAPEAEYICYFDHDKIEKILYNLLSNAFKVTPPYGLISVKVNIEKREHDDKDIHIEISNTGVGIRREDLTNLFSRFYRTNSYSDGTGIGLYLTKSLIELQGGSIDVISEETSGTSFRVRLPIHETSVETSSIESFNKNVLTATVSDLSPQKNEESFVKISSDPHAKTVLIVEDDEDMRKFICDLLQPFYTVVCDASGEAGVKSAYRYQPDLVISDMMMPGMDGYEFMRTIKKDPNISHIPIILLTGKATVEARLLGLEEGADDYITKPFNEKILLARVKNLIEQRRQMKERFSTDLDLNPKEMTITTVDGKFMQNLTDLVEANITAPDFNAEVICQKLGVGRSYLYSKIKAITDLSVNEFIKTMRLKRAAVLLQTTDKNVNEVAHDVGFNDRSHFSKSFTKHFGVAPAQYQKERVGSKQSSQ